MLRKGISIVVPTYNNARGLPLLIQRLATFRAGVSVNLEVVVVNDGSADDTERVLSELCVAHPWVRGLSLMRNYGQHNATLCAIREAQYDITVTMDDDLQHPPEEISKLMEVLVNSNLDVVYGLPKEAKHSPLRRFLSVLTKWALSKAMRAPTARDISAFRALRTRLRDGFTDYRSPQVVLDVLLSWSTSKFGATRVKHDPRGIGRSNYSYGMLVNQALLIITGYSTLPLRLATVVGFMFTIFGLGVLAYVIVIYLTAGSVPGFPFLASIVALFSGAQLFSLGVIGEYLARIFHRSLDRPSYVVSAEFGKGAPRA